MDLGTTTGHDIVLAPNGVETWRFSNTTGNLTQNATDGGSLIFSKAGTGVVDTVTASIACAGTNQGTATQLTKTFSLVTSCATGEGVLLSQVPVGSGVYIIKPDAATSNIKVYPESGGQIDDLGVNAAYTISSSGAATKHFIHAATHQWYSIN